MVKKRKIKVYFLTSILIMTIISTILIIGVRSSQKWCQPIFEGIHNIINSYDFSTKPSFPFDFLSGSTPYSTQKIYIEDDKIEFRYSIIVNDSISKIIENISSMIDDINDFTLDYKSYKIPIYIYLDFYSDDGYLAVESKKLTFIDKEIFLQIDDSVDINFIFDHLKDFHYISIGGV
ncbi:MAG: hypothetical protein ACI4J7_01880 [Ruminiclostridium sp.]